MKRSQSFFVYALLVGVFMYFPLETTAQTKPTALIVYHCSQQFDLSSPSYKFPHIASTKSITASNMRTSIMPNELLEYSKIILMTTVSAVCYGITHDLVTTQINLDYFASDRTHHGPYTRKYFPYIYKSNNKVLYALLWGTLGTCWVGLPLGLIWAVAARYGDAQKLTWHDLMKWDAILTGSMLATSLTMGIVDYLIYRDSFSMVAAMHHTSYTAGILGGIMTAFFIYHLRNKPITPDTSVFHLEPDGIRINLANLLFKSNEPQPLDIQN
jgi:hypothetical protein